MPNQEPIVCQKHGAYTDAAGALHFMQPGDVVPVDAREVRVAIVDCYFENDARDAVIVTNVLAPMLEPMVSKLRCVQ